MFFLFSLSDILLLVLVDSVHDHCFELVLSRQNGETKIPWLCFAIPVAQTLTRRALCHQSQPLIQFKYFLETSIVLLVESCQLFTFQSLLSRFLHVEFVLEIKLSHQVIVWYTFIAEVFVAEHLQDFNIVFLTFLRFEELLDFLLNLTLPKQKQKLRSCLSFSLAVPVHLLDKKSATDQISNRILESLYQTIASQKRIKNMPSLLGHDWISQLSFCYHPFLQISDHTNVEFCSFPFYPSPKLPHTHECCKHSTDRSYPLLSKTDISLKQSS